MKLKFHKTVITLVKSFILKYLILFYFDIFCSSILKNVVMTQ